MPRSPAAVGSCGKASGSGAGGSLYLLGNNTYTGGTLLNAGSGVNFNNDDSFGTGRITWGVAQQVLAERRRDRAGHAGQPCNHVCRWRN